jgi:aspartate/methionine/tyrosine aminotransferase
MNQVLSLKSNLDSGMALPMQLAAAEALQTPFEWMETNNSEYKKRRLKAVELAHALGCSVAGGKAGLFLWVKMPETGLSSKEFVKRAMYDMGVILAPGSLFGLNGEGYLRISLCADVSIFDKAIQQVHNSVIKNHKN